MQIGRSVSSAVAAHAALDTGVHGVGASTILSATDIATLIATHSDLLTGIHGYEMVRKAADQIVNNSVVLVNDDHLLLALGANEVWQIDLFILCTGHQAQDIKLGFAYPIACLIYWGTVGAGLKLDSHTWGFSDTGDMPILLVQTGTEELGTNATNVVGYRLSLIVINGANAGNVNLQWAQVVAAAEDTTVLENSCLIAHQLA